MTARRVSPEIRAAMKRYRARAAASAWKDVWSMPGRCRKCGDPVVLKLRPFRWLTPEGEVHQCR